MKIKLSKFEKKNIYDGGYLKNLIWYIINNLIINSFLPFSKLRIFLLRLFGAKIRNGVILKPYIYIKFPWKLEIGDDTWIGEKVWIDNIERLVIEDNCCISQGVYFCTGNHDFNKETFDLKAEEIIIKSNTWISAMAVIGPGVIVEKESFIKLGEIIKKNRTNS